MVTTAKPCKVVLVDDEVEYLETLVKRLTRRGLSATAVHSGADALDRIEKGPPDVVVLDVKMPGMDGIATLREIKKSHPLVEVIMLTGHADVEAAIEGMELGAFDYLVKPTDIEELLFKIQDAHEKKSIQEAKIDKMHEAIRPVE
jgi:DNA-binding NtrC family response regulator